MTLEQRIRQMAAAAYSRGGRTADFVLWLKRFDYASPANTANSGKPAGPLFARSLDRAALFKLANASNAPVRIAIARHLHKLRNFNTAAEIFKTLDLRKLEPVDLVVAADAMLSARDGVLADKLLLKFLAKAKIADLNRHDATSLGSWIVSSGLSSDEKLSQIQSLARTDWNDQEHAAWIAREYRYKEFQLRSKSDVDPLDFVDFAGLDLQYPSQAVRYIGPLKAMGHNDVAKQLLDRLTAVHGLGHAGTVKAALTYGHEWTEDELEAIPVAVAQSPEILALAARQKSAKSKELRGPYEALFERSLKLNLAHFATANIYHKDRILRNLLALDLWNEAFSLVPLDRHIPNTVLSATTIHGVMAFAADRARDAVAEFTTVLEEDASDTFVADVLRVALPRAGRPASALLDLRYRIGYGRPGAGRPGVRMDLFGEYTTVQRLAGNHVTSLVSAGKRAHWHHFKKLYGHKFLNAEPLPTDSKSSSLFLMTHEGVGDEVRLAQFYQSLRTKFRSVTVTCDPRWLTLFRVNFPDFRFIPVARNRPGTEANRDGKQRFRSHHNTLTLMLNEEVRPFLEEADYITYGQTILFNHLVGKLDAAKVLPYLRADDSLCPPMLTKTRKLKVGLIWRSSLLLNWRRYMYLRVEDFAPLLDVEGVEFYSIQHEMTPDETEFCRKNGISTIDGVDLYNDFDGLAACLSRFDLIIGISTLPTELAAAVGARIWLLGFTSEYLYGRTRGNGDNRDEMTVNSEVIAPPWIDFTASTQDCVRNVMMAARERLIAASAIRAEVAAQPTARAAS